MTSNTESNFPLYDQCNVVKPYNWLATLYNMQYLSPASSMNVMLLIAHYAKIHNVKINYIYDNFSGRSTFDSHDISPQLQNIISNYVELCVAKSV